MHCLYLLLIANYASLMFVLYIGRKIPQDPKSWKDEFNGDTENLWLNLSTGEDESIASMKKMVMMVIVMMMMIMMMMMMRMSMMLLVVVVVILVLISAVIIIIIVVLVIVTRLYRWR